MNKRSLLSRLVLLFVLSALFSNCSRAQQEDPKPTDYVVHVQITGSKMTGVGGSAAILSTRDYAGTKGAPVEDRPILRQFSATETTINERFDLGKFAAGDRVRARVEMSGYGPEPVLRADILVNGVVKKSCFVKGGGVFSECELLTDTL